MTTDPVETDAGNDREATSVGRSRGPPDAWFVAVAVVLVVVNLLASLLLPTDGIWESDRAAGYRLHLLIAFSGLDLVATPVVFLAEALRGNEVSGTLAAALGWWCAAALAIVLVARVRSLPPWRRALYAYLIGAQLSGFLAVHYSTLGT